MYSLVKKYRKIPREVRASFCFLMCSFLQRGISVITTPIFTRLLSTQEYGQYSVFQSWLDVITVFVSLKLYAGVFLQGIVKKVNKYKFASSMQGLSTVLIICWGLVYVMFNHFFNEIFSLTTVQMLAMLSMIWTTGIFNYWSVEQRMDNNYGKLVAVTLLVSFAKPVVGIFLIFVSKDKVTSRIIGLAVVELVVYMGLFIEDMRKGKCFFDRQIWKYALAFNIPLIPHYLSMAVLNSSDRIMIKYYQGESEAGIYNLAYSLALLMTVFNNALLQTMEPWLYKKINQKEVNDIAGVSYMTLLLVAVVNIVLIAVAPEVVRVCAPPEYAEAVKVIPSVSMSVYFMYSYSLFASFEFYYEKTRHITVATLTEAVFNIVLNSIFIPKFGYCAAGYTTLLCYILFAVMHYISMSRICKDKMPERKVFDSKIILGITMLFIGISIVFMISYKNSIIRYGIFLLLFVLVYVNKRNIIHILKVIRIMKKNAD